MADEYKVLIGGDWKTTETPLEVRSPHDGSVVAGTWLCGPEELGEAVGSSHASFGKLRKMPAYRRADLITRVARGIEAREKDLAETIAREAGKPVTQARGEVRRAANTFTIAAEEARRQGGEVVPLDTSPGSEGRFGIVRRFPVGVVLAITPFNFPLNLVAHKVAPAMACGNPIVVKPSEKTPLTALKLGEIIAEAGWPAGGVNVVPALGPEAGKLLEDDRVKKLTFTGSAAVGWALKAKAGQRRVTLELGGNAGVIIDEDTDLVHAAKRCTVGAFTYAGQVCISVQRIYVHEKVFDRFRDLYLEEVAKLKVGDPMIEATDVGPMIEEAACLSTEEWVREAVESGAELLAGGKREGPYFRPTVLTGTERSMKVCGSEIFAPVTTLERFTTFEEAVDEVNHGLYGLQAGVFTKDISKAFHAYETLEVGGVVVNDIPTYRVDNMPYGGVKMSGFGREGVRYAMEEMTEPRLLAMNP